MPARYLPVRSKPWIGGDIGDDHLGMAAGGSATRGPVIGHGGEILHKLRAEPALGRDPQRPRVRVGELDVPPLGVQQRQGERPRLDAAWPRGTTVSGCLHRRPSRCTASRRSSRASQGPPCLLIAKITWS